MHTGGWFSYLLDCQLLFCVTVRQSDFKGWVINCFYRGAFQLQCHHSPSSVALAIMAEDLRTRGFED